MESCDYTEPALFGPEEPICPYTGLRTFTEDEAIYFRGREEHVAKCLTLLGAERFVMITGASGDGKSSLVFAGLLPEVRAGFLRGRYSNWAVATFRPERSPLRNMARSLAPALHLERSVEAIETELEHGFSALVQLYQASSLCPPAELPASLTVAEQRQHRRQAANLLVVVDQFEEFFTNPENYADGHPSTAAQTVVNLLLETTRLAQAQGLPIYIVCTMRSDFVGQCAEFGGLIEQIGASQYFVPRLLRHEFVEVIKEPALLSGNRISERLVQRLLYDIHFGQDQLPVLQHALRRIWLAANQGREEMDLIHYAMVGGLADELPATDQARFAQWQAGLSAVQRQFLLGQPSLRNVLDAHANQLYYEATSLYNQDFQPPLPPGVAESVIERTFRVLTRTDGQRVVRNRLSGAEITAIIGDAALPWPVVCHILRPFRQAGTTFLSPFLLEDDDDRAVLPPEVVLDITHESLIRNWTHLTEWAGSEAEDVRIAQDLMQQAGRWEANAETKGFLLPIGPYSYFARWNAGKKVSANWLAYYLTAADRTASGRERAATQYTTLTRFLQASRRNLVLPLWMARYKLGRLAAALLLLLPVLLVGLGAYAWVMRKQQADYVAYSIMEARLPYLTSPYVPVADNALLLINVDRLKDFVYSPWFSGQDAKEYAFPYRLDALKNDTLALNIELSMYQWVNNEQYDVVEREHPWSRRLLLDLDRRLTQASTQPGPAGHPARLGARQRQLAVYTAQLVMAISYYLAHTQLRAADGNKQDLIDRKRRLLLHLLAYARQEVATTSGSTPSPAEYGFCLRVLLGQGNFSPAELQFLDGINPLVPGSAARQQFLRIFPRTRAVYAHSGSLGHSGGYLTSAIVVAAQRRPAQVVQCLDSLRRYTTPQTHEADGSLALIPYLVKYELFTPDNAKVLLDRCSLVGNISFSKLYAATVYSLLSVSPSIYCYAVNLDNYEAATKRESTQPADASPTGSLDPDLLNIDRVSFSVSNSVRDKTWAALWAAIPNVAERQLLFYKKGPRQSVGSGPSAYQRNTLFLKAFLAKNYGIYLAAIEHDSAAAAQSFANFSRTLVALQPLFRPGELIEVTALSLAPAEETADSTHFQHPIRYLQQPTRPKTIEVGSYFTCPPDAFFLYQLHREAKQLVPDAQLVQLLDSVTFVEVASPDRVAYTRRESLQVSAFTRDPAYTPNLVWMKASQAVVLPLGSVRQQRNAFLYTVSAALQDSAQLAQLRPARDVLPFVRQLGRQPGFAQVPLGVLLSDLATALARAGRGHEAFALAAALPASLSTISAIRVGEQLMLRNDQSQNKSLDSFLLAYQRRLIQHPLNTANSTLALMYWRLKKVHQLHGDFPQAVTILMREGRTSTQENGPAYACKGRSLADDSYQAMLDAPTYQSESLRQKYFNTILTGLAHLKTFKPGDGWREYDEKQLLKPADYDGPVK